jgi:putative ribosome biogenesis GTPase RsgA
MRPRTIQRSTVLGSTPTRAATSAMAEDSSLVMVRLAEVSGMVVAGLAGFGKTMLVAHLLGQLAPSPAVQFVLIDGKGGPTTTNSSLAPGSRPKTI